MCSSDLALPGTGKTTLGKWLEAISLKLNFKIAVISIDDFYLPSNEMKLAIKNNPWNVSRGFPGSHSVKLMHEKLLNWKINGKLNVPVFDKSLRNGLGDRSYWRSDNPDLLVLEGWFLGIEPFSEDVNYQDNKLENLTFHESDYVRKIQKNLNDYLDTWSLLDNIWHLKPLKFEYMNTWKINQEKEMFLQKGKALQDEKLSNFLRMLNVSIPHLSFDNLNIRDNLLRGIYSYGFEKPSNIQYKSIPIINSKKDLIAQSQSGTGKTGAFTIGILNNIDIKDKSIQLVVTSPPYFNSEKK